MHQQQHRETFVNQYYVLGNNDHGMTKHQMVNYNYEVTHQV